MIEKDRIKKNFEKSIKSYDENAEVQKRMAQKLVSLLPLNQYLNILEIGSYSGVLTSEINKNIKYQSYLALDVVEKSGEYLEKIDKNIRFINADIEVFETEEKFDLIVSNAALQWCGDFSEVIKKLNGFLKPDGMLAISIFSDENLKEIKTVFGVSLKYPSQQDILQLFSSDSNILEEKIQLKFNTPIKAMRHLKNTGVNSLRTSCLTVSQMRKNLKRLEEEFENTLTYTPMYIIGRIKEQDNVPT